MINTVDYIIPLCNMGTIDCRHRIQSINYTIRKFLAVQKDININLILVEQIIDKNLPLLTSSLIIPQKISSKIIKVSFPIFNKGWLYNIGVKNAISNNILLTEADVFVNSKEYLKGVINYATTKKINWFFAWNKIYYINSKAKDILFSEDRIVLDNYDRVSTPNVGSTEGGIVYFNKEFYMNSLGGASELFRELGGIDNEIIRRSTFLYPHYIKYPHRIIHIWHKKSEVKEGRYRNDNRNIYHYTKLRPRTVTEFIKKNMSANIEYPLSYTKTLDDIIRSDDKPLDENKYKNRKSKGIVIKTKTITVKKLCTRKVVGSSRYSKGRLIIKRNTK